MFVFELMECEEFERPISLGLFKTLQRAKKARVLFWEKDDYRRGYGDRLACWYGYETGTTMDINTRKLNGEEYMILKRLIV